MTQVIILCGGKGRRMRNLSIYPKPLVKISKKPILKYLIDYFLKNGLEKIILATGHKSKKVENFVNKNYKIAIKISNAGNVDVLKKVLKSNKPLIYEDFIICYGDTLANIDLLKLKKRSKKLNLLMTTTLAELKIDFGIAEINKNKITKFIERPTFNNKNIGFFYCKKGLANEFSKSKNWVSFLKKIARTGNMGFFLHKGRELTVNTPEELSYAKKN